jgi:hypothetical protein
MASGRGEGGGSSELLSLPGFLKITEIVLLLVAVIIHRHGNNGGYIFFGSTEYQLQTGMGNNGAGELEAENLGNGALVSFLIISSVLLISYVLDGRAAVQRLFIEWFWNLLGFCMLVGAGCRAIVTWHDFGNSPDTSANLTGIFSKNSDAALTMAAFCILAGLVYLVDFFVAYSQRKRLKQEVY